MLLFESELDYEQLMLFLETGLASARTTGTGPYVHCFAPNLASAPSVRSATYEYVVDDGTKQHFERAFSFGTTLRLTIDLAFDQTARMATEIFGRAEQPVSAVASTSALTRTPVQSSDFTLSIDDAWADLGLTQRSSAIRAASLDLFFGLVPDYTFDGRADPEFTALQWGRVRGALNVTLEHDADAAAEVQAWRDRTQRFIRLHAASGTKSLQFDMSGFYTAAPRIRRERDDELVTLNYALAYDPVSGEALQAELVNDLAGL